MTRRLLASLVATALAVAAHAADSPEGVEFFEKRIRPLLADKCYECHSAGAKKLKGGLYLDSNAGWTKGGDTGPAIVPGKPDESLLIKAIRWSDPDTQMPPKNKLPAADIAALEQWVKMGAPDPRASEILNLKSQIPDSPATRTNHWAYQPLRKPSPPAVKDAAWPATDIDRFILAKLQERGLRPAAPAEPATLCRRLHFDLTGLPPTPEDLDAFTQSAIRNPQSAIKNLVDHLLASPRFGEHWGRHWLDVARFGESLTLRGFIFKEAWRYRDYVIDSFNRDAPFDQFIREQIAGDLLPHTSVEQRRRQLIAATFLALGNTNLEEQDKKQLDMDVVDEQLDTLGKAFLGQAIGCARCHDHKFDPIPTRDYYAMAGILRSTRLLKHANVSEWLEFPLPVEAKQEATFAKHEAAVAALEGEIKSAKESAKKLAPASDEPKPGSFTPSVTAAGDLPGMVVDSAQAKQVGTWKHSAFSKHYIGDGYLHDDQQGKGEKTLSFAPELTRPGRYEVRFAYQHGGSRATNVPVTVFHADGETVVHVNEQESPLLDGRFVSLGQFRFEANGFGYVLVGNEGTHGHVTADAVQFLPADEPSLAERGPSRPAAASTGGRAADRDSPRSVAQSDIKALEAHLKKLKDSGPKRPMTMGVKEGDTFEDTPIHVRGSVHNLGAVAPRGFLTFGRPVAQQRLSDHESGRRELGDWIASHANPLTARVYVNRVWLWLIGEGLVRTPDNFGTTGETPTHPELLDHLAAQLIEQKWSTKRLVREIVFSRTYQLSSVVSEPVSGKQPAAVIAHSPTHPLTGSLDPENRWLAHAHRRRLTAEQLRDAILAVSGQLKLDAGGPGYPAAQTADFGFVFDGPRRSVYAPVFRNALPQMFEVFDFAPSSMVTGRRNVSTVPTQALFLLNHPWVREQAQAAARRALDEPAQDDDARLDRAYRHALGRPPTDAERTLARRHLAQAGPRADAWTELFHALFASADFRYLD